MDQLQIVTIDDPFGLRLIGEIDMATAPALKEALLVALADGRPVTVDMRRVTFIDSSGVQVIMSCASEVPSDEPLRVKDPSAVVRRVLELVGMEKMPQIRVIDQGNGN